MKRILSITALILTVATLTACSSGTATSGDTESSAVSNDSLEMSAVTLLTEDSAKEIVETNMPIADKFYAIYNRCSLPVDESASVTDDNGFSYSPVESVYTTLGSLKEDTEKYFTKEYLEGSFYLNLADETAFYKDIDGKLYKNNDAVSDGRNIWDTASCVISDLTDNSFTATVPYLDLYESHRSAKIYYVLDGGSYKINKWLMNLDAIQNAS
ncbi:MAG: lipoprotein [Ruminiclostridium sp.]